MSLLRCGHVLAITEGGGIRMGWPDVDDLLALAEGAHEPTDLEEPGGDVGDEVRGVAQEHVVDSEEVPPLRGPPAHRSPGGGWLTDHCRSLR